MVLELRVPAVGESIKEVVISSWLKAPGDPVSLDENLVVLETDKVTVELPAPAAGTLVEIRHQGGETVPVGAVIGLLAEGHSPAGGGSRPEPASAAEPAAASGPDSHVMPAARHLLAEKGLDPSAVRPTGPGGRLLKEDVLRHEAPLEASSPGASPGPPTPVGGSDPLPQKRAEESVPMTPLRRRVAERLLEAQHGAALLTTFNEIDMAAVMALRREFRDAFQETHQARLGFMSFFVKAVVDGLRRVPRLNAEIRGDHIVYRNYHDIGIAVGGGKGLVVPVIRGAERLGFAQIEAAIADFARRAEANRINLEELQGGTFTISNGGIYGSLLSTPIVNPPQSGILGLHAIQDRPVAREGQVVIRPMMYVALTYDHRIVDGREAVSFLVRVKECMENPARILLEV